MNRRRRRRARHAARITRQLKLEQLRTASKTKTATRKPELERLRRRLILQGCLTVLPVLLLASVMFGMSSAWYTNVVKQSAITVQAGAWNFSPDNITVTQSADEISPGKSVLFSVKVKNTEAAPINVRVDAQKTGMDPKWQKRIYFYVEETFNAGEANQSVVRNYLANDHGYIYKNIAANSEVELSADSDKKLYVEWVHDVLGYYIKGTVSKVVGGGFQLSNDAEYLQPVVYEYNNATYDNDGKLVTTGDGKSLNVLLNELYAEYNQSYDTSVPNYGSLYPVEIKVGADQESASGVWLYLCTRDEIAAANAEDTQLGHDSSTFGANLIFSIQNAAG